MSILEILNKILDNRVSLHFLSNQSNPTKFVFDGEYPEAVVNFSFSRIKNEFFICVEKIEGTHSKYFRHELNCLSEETLNSNSNQICNSIYEDFSLERKTVIVGEVFENLCQELHKLLKSSVEEFDEVKVKPNQITSLEKRFIKTFSNIYNLFF